MMTRLQGITRFDADGLGALQDDVLAVEEPLEIRVEGQTLVTVLRTPGNDRELVAGWLLAEGIVRNQTDLFDVVQCPSVDSAGNVVEVHLSSPDQFEVSRFVRRVVSNSSCGMCSRTLIDEVAGGRGPVVGGFAVGVRTLQRLPEALRAAQSAFDATGGIHAAALFDTNGKLLAVREDVGRHNAVDKLLGWALFSEMLPLSKCGLLVSGRVAFEIVQKAWVGGIPLIAAIGAASSMAVETAQSAGQTLIGFLRDDRMNVYCGKIGG